MCCSVLPTVMQLWSLQGKVHWYYLVTILCVSLVISNPNILQLKRSEESLDNIKQFYVWCTGEDGKFVALSNLYGVLTIGQCIVFCHVSCQYTSLASSQMFSTVFIIPEQICMISKSKCGPLLLNYLYCLVYFYYFRHASLLLG